MPAPETAPVLPETTAAWTRLQRAAAHTLARIEARLGEADLPALQWYDALWEIEKAGPEGIRPYVLEERLLLPQYGLSRLIDRLVRAGLVRRGPAADDRRGQILWLTEDGRALRARMWTVYAPALNEVIAGRLAPGEAADLARLLARLLG